MPRFTKAPHGRRVLAVAAGQGLVEYALILAYIALAVIVAVVFLRR